MSTHAVEVVPVQLEPHPNADTLSIVRVFGFTVCVRTADWRERKVGAYIPPDSIVDTTRPEFAFLAGHERIRVKKLRGVVSMGLLVPAPEGAALGENVMDALGVTHYEPPLNITQGAEAAPAPSGVYAPVYDVENARRYAEAFIDGEPVIVTEKIHGANGRYVFDGERMHCGSRGEWKKSGLWWQALTVCPWLEEFCREHPGLVVYGEVFGRVQSLRYDRELDVAVFDIMRGNEWVPAQEARELGRSLRWVPTVIETVWRWPDIAQLAEGQSLIANHVREGVVIKPFVERQHDTIGRVQLKVVGNGYLEGAT